MYKYILFDLDGTLLNTYPGVSNAVRHTMKFYNKPIPEEATMRKYLGPPLADSFRDIAEFPEDIIPEAVKKFREYYLSKGIFEYEFFEELKPTFRMLREKGYTLGVATSKLQPAAFTILKHAGIFDEFDYICGSSADEGRITKADVLENVIEHFGISDKSEAILIGDRYHDIMGAKAIGIDCCCVLCGFGSKEEFDEYGAKYIIDFISDIFSIL